MGYIHDTAMSQFVPPTSFTYSAGTWAMAVASNVWSLNRTAADASFTLYLPIPIPSNSVALKGAYLVSVEFMYSIATAAADDFATVELHKDSLAATGTSGTGRIDMSSTGSTFKDTHCSTLPRAFQRRCRWSFGDMQRRAARPG